MKNLFFAIIGLAIFTACSAEPTDTTSEAKGKAQQLPEGKTIVVDVRTPEEWSGDGHSDCSVNFPLDEVGSHFSDFEKYDSVIFVCRSGGRAGSALEEYQASGAKNKSFNGGSWDQVPCK